MCNRATHSYPSTIPFVPEYYKTQEICDNTVNTLFVFFLGGGGGGGRWDFSFVPDWYKI